MSSTTDHQPSLLFRVRLKMGGYHPVIRWYRQHRPPWFWLRAHAHGRVTARFVKQQGLTVRHGAFAGLQYPPKVVGRVGFIPAKVLGAYETVVVSTLAELGKDNDQFVDIGSAEGYFCVGMARTHPHLRVIGYETTAGERELAAETAKLNGVTIDQRATADHSSLQGLPEGRTLLLVDIEGFEFQMLDPDAVPRLREMSMVVELHDPDSPGIESVLRGRFESSHDIRLIRQDDLDLGPFAELSGWSKADADLAVMERTPGHPGVWMVLTPR